VVIDSTLLTAAAAAASATNFSPFLTNVGFGGLVGFLIGFVIKKLFKILAIMAGVFFAVLIYLEQQGMININWHKLNVAYHGILSTVTNTITNSTTASGGVRGSHDVAASLLPTTMMMTNLSIPLTGSMATGFAIGILKG
jgi:uncharacterized membrane protein (Fun14 family)